MREIVQAYVAGVISAITLVLVNYLLLGDLLFIHIAPLPLMSITIANISFRHFLFSWLFLVTGLIAMAFEGTLLLWGAFLLGMGLTLFIFDVGIPHGVIDLLRTGYLAPAAMIFLLFSILLLIVVAALITRVG